MCGDGERRRENVPCTCMYINTIRRNLTLVYGAYYVMSRYICIIRAYKSATTLVFSPHCCTRRRRRRAPMTTRTLLYTCTVYPSVRPFVVACALSAAAATTTLLRECRARVFIHPFSAAAAAAAHILLYAHTTDLRWFSLNYFWSKIILFFRLVPYSRWTAVYHDK